MFISNRMAMYTNLPTTDKPSKSTQPIATAGKRVILKPIFPHHNIAYASREVASSLPSSHVPR